jgi:hypothetical protein
MLGWLVAESVVVRHQLLRITHLRLRDAVDRRACIAAISEFTAHGA